MRRIWSLLQRQSKAFSSILTISVLFSLISVPQAGASRNGVEQPANSFTVGISFRFGVVEQLCSGVMLNPTIVATAAHCAFSTRGEVGTNYYFTSPGTPLDAAIDPRIDQPKVIKVYSDPNFSALDSDNINDIAFLQLDKPVISKSYLKFATRAELEALTKVTPVAGYGYGLVYETGDEYSIYPRKYELSWTPLDSATAMSSTFSLSSSNSAPCKGDSGGPIVATLPDGKEVLIGMLSGANNVKGGCGNEDRNGLFYIRLTLGYPFLPLISSIYNPSQLAPAPAKKVTIKCKKGSVTQKVTALKPRCPKGYKLVK